MDNEDGEENDKIITSKDNQGEVNDLYTGPSFQFSQSQATVLLLITTPIFFSGAVPLLFPIALAFMSLLYWHDKLLLLKVCQKTEDYDYDTIYKSYSVLKYVIFAHLIVTINMFKNSAALEIKDSKSDDFNNEVTEGIDTDLNQVQKRYVSFIIVIMCLYVFNLFIANPITCFFQEGCCYRLNIGQRKLKKNKQTRAKRYLENPTNQMPSHSANNSLNIELANNTDKQPVSPSHISGYYSQASQMSTITTQQQMIQYQMSMNGWKNVFKHEETSGVNR